MINKTSLLCFVIIIYSSCSVFKKNNKASVQSDIILAKQYLKYINKQDLVSNLTILASDEFEGRETTKQGQKKAAKFIKDFFIENGIDSPIKESYYQQFNVNVSDFTRIRFKINNEKLNIIDDFYVIGSTTDTVLKSKKVVDVLYGIIDKNHDNYKNKEVNNKIVIIHEEIPNYIDPENKWDNWRKKVLLAKEKGAVGVICIKKNYEKSIELLKPYLLYPEMKMHYNVRLKNRLIPYICISKETYNDFFLPDSVKEGLKKGVEPVLGAYNIAPNINVSLNIDIEYKAKAENVLGYVKGQTNELIVISAHYDHLGFDNGEVCNGADDDGSGTVSLMSIAKAFQKAKDDGITPKRSILFLAVSGEEKGLFGSQYYTENPIFPLNKTVANLNIDMVGRIDTVHEDINYIYLIGSDKISKDLHYLNEKINNDHIGFDLDYTFNNINDPNHFYYRSDHYNFAKNGIPVIFYFSGIHRDYHKPTDDVEKINFDKLQLTAQYVFLTAWELVNRDKRIQ